MSDETRRLVDAFDEAVARQARRPACDDFACLTGVREARAALDAHLAKMQAVVDAAVIESARHDEEAEQGMPCELCVAVRALRES